MTKDELISALRSGKPSWGTASRVDLAKLPALEKQRELLQQLGKVLEGVLENDLQQLDVEREKLDRLRRGGGR